MAFDFGQALKRTGEGTVKSTASQALGIPIVGFDPASLGISAGIVAGSWAVSKILGSLFGDNTPPPIETLEIQLADEYPMPYRLGYHRYTGQLLYANATDRNVTWPPELNSRIQNVERRRRRPGQMDTVAEQPNTLDLVYHLSSGKIHGSEDVPSLGGIYINNTYVELTRLGGTDGTVDIFGGRGHEGGNVASEQGPFYAYAYVTVYRGYDDASAGFSYLVQRNQEGEWEADDIDENHSFAVVTLLDYQNTLLGAPPKPWVQQVPEVQFVGPGIELPDLSKYTPTAPRNPYQSMRYTDNLASVMYWVLTTWPEGPRIPHEQFDHRSVYSAYRRCADIVKSQVPDGYAQTEGIMPKRSKRYVFNGTIRAGDEWSRTLADLDAGWLGSVYPQDGYWRFYAGGNAPQRDEHTLVINAKDATRPISYLTQPRREERFNVAHFTLQQSQAHNYKQAPPTIVEYPAGIAREGGEKIVREVSLRGVIDPVAATRLAHDFIRLRNVRTLTANISGAEPDWRALKSYEAVYLTDDKHNIENVPMIVEKKTINQDGSTSLILKHDPSDSFSDSQSLPLQTRIGQRGAKSRPPTNVAAELDYVDVRGQRALRGRVTCTLDRGYDWIDVQWRKASDSIGAAQTIRNDLRRSVRNPVMFISGIEPNTDYLIAVRVGVASVRGGSNWTPELAWPSGDDIRALPNPTGVEATGIIGGAVINFTPVDIDAEPYYKRTEIKVFVGDETEARKPLFSMGGDAVFGGLATDTEHTLRIEARHETKSGVFSGITTASATTLTAASAESGFLGFPAIAKSMVFNNFQSLAANVNANGRWGLSKANTWENIKTLAASDTLYLYQAGTEGTDETAYLDTLEAGDYLTVYLQETQAVTLSFATLTKNNVGTVSAPRYRYDIHAIALSATVRETPEPVLAANTEITMRFSRAIEGLDGSDGAGVEYIFCKNNDTSLPTNQYPNNSWGYDSGGTANSKVWSDGAPELDATDPVLFRAQRKIVGSPNTGDAVPDNWTTPVVVGRIGLDGAAAQAGEDGRGVEYIFRATANANAPPAPSNTRVYDPTAPTDGWSDGAPTLTTALPYLWRCARRVPGLPARNAAFQSTWGNWTAPRIVGRYGADGARGQQGLQGLRGADGTDGQGVEFRFARTRNASPPGLPPFSLRFDQSHSTWFDAAPTINATYPYRWMIQRKVPGTPLSTDVPSTAAGWGNWSSAVLVGRWGAGTPGPAGARGATGATGATGDDGAGIEYVFQVTSTESRPRSPSNSWGYDSPRSPWFDAAPTLTVTNKILWRSQRAVEGSPAQGASVSASWTTPVIVGRYGEDGVDGQDGTDGTPGEDGIGVEYVFARYPENSISSRFYPQNSWAFDRPGTSQNSSGTIRLQWHDGAPSLNKGFQNLYRSQRKVEPSGSTFVRVSGSDGNWTTPTIVGRFASISALADISSGRFQEVEGGGDYIYGIGTHEDTTRNFRRSQMYGPQSTGTHQQNGFFLAATSGHLAGGTPPTPTAGRTGSISGTGRVAQWSNNRLPTTTTNPYAYTVQRYLLFFPGTNPISGIFPSKLDGVGYFVWYFPSGQFSGTSAPVRV